jgi:hypothetical protein
MTQKMLDAIAAEYKKGRRREDMRNKMAARKKKKESPSSL